MILTDRLPLVSVEFIVTYFWSGVTMFIMADIQTPIIPVFYADFWISCRCNYKHINKNMQNERFIKWSYYFLYQRNMTIPARGHKEYRAWDTVMTYNYHAFISCLVISLITSAWKKTASALTVSETTNNLHYIINF